MGAKTLQVHCEPDAGEHSSHVGRDAAGALACHAPACPHLRIRGLASRPASGQLETAELVHQARDQHPECAARGDRPPPAALAGTPPVAALARGDLPGPAGPEPAPALHAPYRANRLD